MMTQRLQVLLDKAEFDEIRAHAAQRRMTVAEWVRQAMRRAREAEAVATPSVRLLAVREAAARYEFPAPDIARMNDEIARGYRLPGDEPA